MISTEQRERQEQQKQDPTEHLMDVNMAMSYLVQGFNKTNPDTLRLGYTHVGVLTSSLRGEAVNNNTGAQLSEETQRYYSDQGKMVLEWFVDSLGYKLVKKK